MGSSDDERTDPQARRSFDAEDEHIQLGDYVLVRHLGSGGMAEVDLARVAGPGRVEKLVVVKRILPEYAGSEVYSRMFLDEARIAATLQHPNIIQIHDVGRVEAQLYIAMEYLRGRDMREILQAAAAIQCNLPLDFIVGTVCCVCSALHYAHQMRSWDGTPLNIVHRDVSPQNIFVTYEGHIKLVDFGLAKADDRLTQTQTGMVKGTFGYMAPEQLSAEESDRRMDVFAAGVVLWEMVTGRRLFHAETINEARAAIQEKGVPSPTEHRPDCPAPIEAVIRRALNKNPAQRYQTARGLQEDLERVAQQASLWLSPLRRATVMDALYPGKRDQPLQEMTEAVRPPSPVLHPVKLASRAQRLLHAVSSRLQEHPVAALVALATLTVLVFTLGIAIAFSDGPGDQFVPPPPDAAVVKRPRPRKKGERSKPARQARPVRKDANPPRGR